MKKLPLFFHHPTICWVDDNELFLNAANNLFKENYPCVRFANPEEAVNYLNTYQSPSSKINFTRGFIESDLYDTHNHLPVDINISEITKIANTSILRNELGILVIDNNMPNITGIEICHKFKSAPYKKILLTGETSPIEAIDAFNHGIIDKFIAKDQNVSENLQQAIFELSIQYFYDITKNLIAHLETSKLTPLSDPEFINFFFDWCAKSEIKEFYLINKHGSFLVKDKDNCSSNFIVMSESSINDFIKLNDDALDKVEDLLLKVVRREHLPFFGIGKEHWEINYDEWKNYFYPCNIIQGREKYFWTVVNSKEI